MIFTFEQKNDLNYILAKNSSICLSKAHYKDGNHALKWDYKEPFGELQFDVDIGYQDVKMSGKDSRRYAFGVYIYSETQQDQMLHFGFYKEGHEQCGFDVYINFIGWRSIFVKFDKDMEGKPVEGMECLKITTSGEKGRLYLDQLVTSNLFDTRSAVASYQVPFVSSPKSPRFTNYSLMQMIPPQNKSTETQEMIEIGKRYTENIIHNFYQFQKSEEEILAYYSNLQITKNQSGIVGKTVEYHWHCEIYLGQDYPIPHNPIDLREYVTMMFSIAYSYYKTQKDDFKDMYITMLEHLIDQGLQEGSSMGVIHHIDYSLRMFYPSVFLMKEAIKESGMLDTVRKLMRWFSEFGMIFIKEYIPDLVTADTLNNLSQSFFISALLSGDAACLKAFQSWLNMHLSPTIGLAGLIKEDGSIYHHCGHYTIYGMDGLTGLMPVIYVLSGTQFQISEESWALLSKVLFNMRFYVNKYDMPLTMSGRHPHGQWKINLVPFRYWALAGLARGDEQPVAVYKRLRDEDSVIEDSPLMESKVQAESDPVGQLTMNMACAAFHRWEDVLVSVKGFSKYMWGNETYVANNLYGRYMSYSHLEILRNSQKESGFSQEGFDWAALPGTTAIHLPIDKMRAQVYNLDDVSGFEEMLISDQAFAGGVDNGTNGMFAMKLHGHPKYDGSHCATLSKIFADGFVLCLGSDISNNETEYPTYTTLLQKTGNSEVYEDKIIDCMGNAYYPAKGQKVRVNKGLQISQDQAGKGENRGEYTLCFIDHGTAPNNAEYEYGISLLGREKPAYEVLRKDRVAHVVRFGNTLYYAIFEPNEFEGCAYLQKTDHMILLMVEERDGELVCSACQPDLGLYDYDASQYDEAGNRIEVSMYSRSWLKNPVKEYKVKLILNGKNIDFAAKGGEVVHFNIK